jgi:hypothetical protein
VADAEDILDTRRLMLRDLIERSRAAASRSPIEAW